MATLAMQSCLGLATIKYLIMTLIICACAQHYHIIAILESGVTRVGEYPGTVPRRLLVNSNNEDLSDFSRRQLSYLLCSPSSNELQSSRER